MITVYDRQMNRTGFVENADKVGYDLKLNDISTASFSLPYGDGANALLRPRAYVSIPDGGRDIGLFRVIAQPSASPGMLGRVEYSLEHVCATLMDDCIPGFLTLGGEGVTTADVIEAILARQSTARWVLDECDFDDEFEYTFENTDLLSALFSLGNVLAADEYVWKWDTSTTPWRVSLKAVSQTPESGILYRRNLVSISKSVDDTGRITRIYPRGSGEGDNQVNIKSVNNGVEYLDATPEGEDVIAVVYVDTSIEDPELLLAAAQQILDGHATPQTTYEVSAIDYSRESGLRFDRHEPGDCVRVLDSEDGVELVTRVVGVRKDDVRGKPGQIVVTLSTAARDASDQIAELSSRVGVTQLYSQGATNLYSQQYADNAGPDEPGIMRFYIPSECVRINKVLLSWKLRPFRGYTKAASSAGGQISVSTTLGGETTLTASQTTSTLEDARSGYSMGQGGGYTLASNGSVGTHSAEVTSTESAGAYEAHNHMVSAHSHSAGTHTHYMDHYHNINHTHTIPGHSHQLAGHTHTVEAQAHSHGTVFGIYNGTTASTASLVIDGTERYVDQAQGNEVDITQYLEMSDGRIRRGTWHEIQIVPDRLTRIEANLFVQLFIQSRGGGDY